MFKKINGASRHLNVNVVPLYFHAVFAPALPRTYLFIFLSFSLQQPKKRSSDGTALAPSSSPQISVRIAPLAFRLLSSIFHPQISRSLPLRVWHLPSAYPATADLNELISNYTPNPVLVIINANPTDDLGIPTDAYGTAHDFLVSDTSVMTVSLSFAVAFTPLRKSLSSFVCRQWRSRPRPSRTSPAVVPLRTFPRRSARWRPVWLYLFFTISVFQQMAGRHFSRDWCLQRFSIFTIVLLVSFFAFRRGNWRRALAARHS